MTQNTQYLENKPEWLALAQHQLALAKPTMREWFSKDHNRSNRYTVAIDGLTLDYSRQLINQETLTLLENLAKACDLSSKITALFNGARLNTSENRAALHTALRDLSHSPTYVDGKNIMPLIQEALMKMQAFTDQIHHGTWVGVTGKRIQHVITIGIGGSYLGPKLACTALKDFSVSDITFHFIATPDEALQRDIQKQIDPETTLIIVSSKTFGTLETLTNARVFANWMHEHLGAKAFQHFFAVTACPEKAISFGIDPNNIFPLWDWVGGRYSVWSAIGLPLMLMVGSKHFTAFLAGAFAIDQHFQQAEFKNNLPVLLALLGIWNINFHSASAEAVIPYSYRLRYLTPYLQQTEMESNGKQVDIHGRPIHYRTSAIIFGEEGCNGQHSYHQLLHQGQHFIPVDFILLAQTKSPQALMHASGLSQAHALMLGKTFSEAKDALLLQKMPAPDAEHLAKHQVIPGNKPCNVLTLSELTPKNLGALLALYEHKTFVQGAIWNINSFDQWGVELGKQLLPRILQQLQTKAEPMCE